MNTERQVVITGWSGGRKNSFEPASRVVSGWTKSPLCSLVSQGVSVGRSMSSPANELVHGQASEPSGLAPGSKRLLDRRIFNLRAPTSTTGINFLFLFLSLFAGRAKIGGRSYSVAVNSRGTRDCGFSEHPGSTENAYSTRSSIGRGRLIPGAARRSHPRSARERDGVVQPLRGRPAVFKP